MKQKSFFKETLWLLLIIFTFSTRLFSQDINERIKLLEEKLKAQESLIQQQQSTIKLLQEELELIKKQSGQEKIVAKVEEKPAYKSGGLFGATSAYNPNISLILDTFLYSTNLKEDELESWNIPGFIKEGLEHKKGMNIHAAELYFFAPVDPFFNLYATIPVTEEGVELEEAYLVTTFLPAGIQAKIGKFKSGFGRHNSQHAHLWKFVDEPLVYRALTGHEGINEKGIQLTFLPDFPFYAQLGIEALQGENEILFGLDRSKGLHAFGAFAKASFDIGDYGTILLGPSVMIGDTKTESIEENSIFTGDTTLAAFEFTYKWKPSRWKSFTLQSEYMWRKQKGKIQDTSTSTINNLKRIQDGLYLQTIYQTGRWGFGARYDLLEPLNDKYNLDGVQTSFGDKPWRASAMVEFNPSEFSKIRLQYNYDKSSRTGKTNNEVYLQFIGGVGAHAAHSF
ncbi:MAG: SlyX family protein [Candidatus Omnitrophica bacterium]|nr:SlyX family protein [Candidatus Omnitrophota bacterium]